jgi:glycosyltransferase involved in cell wall biosynthesis
MISKPLVSVVIIFLNAEKFIQEAIESVFAQTYDNWEMLLVDDGSTDNSTKIALQYTEQYPGKVRYLEHEGHQNRGMSASRNLGIYNATGEYIAILDADDLWLPRTLEEQVTILKAHPEAAMVYGPIQFWYSWTGKPEDIERDFVPKLWVQPETLIEPPLLLKLFLECKPYAVPSGILIRRKVIKRLGGFEETFRSIYEDQVFCAKVCLHEPVFVSSKCWYKYRQHPSSSCSVGMKTGEYYSSRLLFLNWLEEYLSKQKVRNTDVWDVLQKELWSYRHPTLHRLLGGLQKSMKQSKGLMQLVARATLPVPIRYWLKTQLKGKGYVPQVDEVRFGNLRRVKPFSCDFGVDRGLPIDRYYIEQFLSTHVLDIRGHVLEIKDETYTRQFGGDRVTKSDVIHITEGNPKATIVADLTCAEHIPSNTFDCAIVTQTLQLIYDVQAAIKTLHRILKPSGIVLATFPGISQISRYDMNRWGYYWGFTTLSAKRLFEEVFPVANVQVEANGNVLAAISFLQGLATQELRQEELDYCDPDYEVLITVRAVKPEVT